jgi:hypothetical protein
MIYRFCGSRRLGRVIAQPRRSIARCGLVKGPSKPVSLTTVGDMLRDRYYIGYVEYDGMEYQGRHQPLAARLAR